MMLTAMWTAMSILGQPPAAQPDLRTQMKTASVDIQKALPEAERLLKAGKRQEATDALLATFPEPGRTAAQALVLGNVLFRQEPAVSLALHQRAAKDLPDDPSAQLEWALELQRARRYDEACVAYSKVVVAMPGRAPVLGLMAECLIQCGKDAEAAESWAKSENAQEGTLEEFETMLCELHGPPEPRGLRAAFLPGAERGDIAAIENLIALDLRWEPDWWNSGPNIKLLQQDLSMVRKLRLANSPRLAALQCAADCAIAADKDQAAVKGTLIKRRFLIGKEPAIPEDGRILASMLSLALEADALSVENARETLGELILAQARKTKDAETFNAAAHLYLGTDQLRAIDAEAWEATGDVRFAGSWLAGADARNELRSDTRELLRATKQFPENSVIAGFAVRAAKREQKPLRPYLVAAIKAEYMHLSPGGLVGRVKASALRAYFRALKADLETAKKSN